jgi:hypothetical protein
MMVAAKFDKADPDMSSRVGRKGKTKEIRDRPLAAAGSDPGRSAMVGGVSNTTVNPSEKKAGARQAFNRGGKVNGIPAHVEGGFRNRGMANRR